MAAVPEMLDTHEYELSVIVIYVELSFMCCVYAADEPKPKKCRVCSTQ
jgi:hypothetical protein